jgi:hypothetical protein
VAEFNAGKLDLLTDSIMSAGFGSALVETVFNATPKTGRVAVPNRRPQSRSCPRLFGLLQLVGRGLVIAAMPVTASQAD